MEYRISVNIFRLPRRTVVREHDPESTGRMHIDSMRMFFERCHGFPDMGGFHHTAILPNFHTEIDVRITLIGRTVIESQLSATTLQFRRNNAAGIILVAIHGQSPGW